MWIYDPAGECNTHTLAELGDIGTICCTSYGAISAGPRSESNASADGIENDLEEADCPATTG